jgi:hypothetical protein
MMRDNKRTVALLAVGVSVILAAYVVRDYVVARSDGRKDLALVAEIARSYFCHAEWPTRKDDEGSLGHDYTAYDKLENRWDFASRTPLGVKEDKVSILEIKLPVWATSLDVRWLSDDVAIAHGGWRTGPVGAANYCFVFWKRSGKWFLKDYYLLSVS